MKRFLKALLLMPVICALLCGCGEKTPEGYRFADVAMGTGVQTSIYAEGSEKARAVSDEIMAYVRQLEQEQISWRMESSELYAVNESAGSGEGYLLSEELTTLLERCLTISRDAEGAFDVTMGPVVRLWGIDRWAAGGVSDYILPEEELLRQTLLLCGSEKIRLKPEICGENGEHLQDRIFMPQGMQLDLGAVGKGATLTEIQSCLERNGVSGAVVSVGGSVLTYGEKPDRSPWKVGIVNPRDTSSQLGVLSLKGQWCVSTSGDYERYVEVDGVRYHHIIDPSNGRPASGGVCSVTVLTKDGFLSDALSTACFILGAEKGMTLARQYDAEVLFVTMDGTILMSEGMKQYFVESA